MQTPQIIYHLTSLDLTIQPHKATHRPLQQFGTSQVTLWQPTPDKKTSTVAVQLVLEILLKFSFPRILHSDDGIEFKSKLTEH